VYEICWGFASTLFLTCVFVILKTFDEEIKKQLADLPKKEQELKEMRERIKKTVTVAKKQKEEVIVEDNEEEKFGAIYEKFVKFLHELSNLCDVNMVWLFEAPMLAGFATLIVWIIGIILASVSAGLPLLLFADTVYLITLVSCLAIATRITYHTRSVACELLMMFGNIEIYENGKSARIIAMLQDFQNHGGFKVFGVCLEFQFLAQSIAGVLGLAAALITLIYRQ